MPKKVEMHVPDWLTDECADLLHGEHGMLLRVNHLPDHPEGQTAREFAAQKLIEVIERFGQGNRLCLAVHEIGRGSDKAEGNPHYQCYFVTTTKIKTIRSNVARIWHGNEMYSLKAAAREKTPEYIVYLNKGSGSGQEDTPDILHASDHFTDEVIAELNATYWRNNDAIQAARPKRKALTASEEILEICKSHGLDGTRKGPIIDHVLAYYRKRVKYMNPRYLQNLVFQTCVYLQPPDANTGCTRNLKEYLMSDNLN